jgi:hypothetical protein
VSTLVTALRSQLAPLVLGYSLPRLSRPSEANWLFVSEDTCVHICNVTSKPIKAGKPGKASNPDLTNYLLVSTFVTSQASQSSQARQARQASQT